MAELDLSAGGRLTVHPFVNARKVAAMSEMISGTRLGGYAGERARTDLKESLSTSDAVFSLAHLVSLRNLPQYDEAPRIGDLIAETVPVDDFKPATFYSLQTNYSALAQGKGNKGTAVVAPVVAEGDTYQRAFGYTEESAKVAIQKRGFKWGITLEDIINDPTRQIAQVPGDMLQIALDTEEFVVISALQDGAPTGNQIAAGDAPITGTAITKNSPFSVDALRLALQQVGQRKVNGNFVPLAPKYYIVVQQGQGQAVEDAIALAKSLIQVQDGNNFYNPAPYIGALGRIAGVLESNFITSSTAWYVVPAAGTTRRTSLVKLQLNGFTAPDVLVSNFTGTPIGSGNGSSPFTLAHFDDDTVSIKCRLFTNGGTVSADQMIWSTGLGS